MQMDDEPTQRLHGEGRALTLIFRGLRQDNEEHTVAFVCKLTSVCSSEKKPLLI